jgi:hypothetical protein
VQGCLSVGTSAIGRKQTRGKTFSRFDVVGEMAPVVEDGSDGLSRREVVDARSVRLPTSSAEPMMTAEKSHRFVLTGSDPEGRNGTIILWRELDLVDGRVVRRVVLTLDATMNTATVFTCPEAREVAQAILAAAR